MTKDRDAIEEIRPHVRAIVLNELAREKEVERRWALGRIRSCERQLDAAHKALASLDERIAELRAEAQALEGEGDDHG